VKWIVWASGRKRGSLGLTMPIPHNYEVEAPNKVEAGRLGAMRFYEAGYEHVYVRVRPIVAIDQSNPAV
jgi:hypothetical protein